EYTVSEAVLPAGEAHAGETRRSANFKNLDTGLEALSAELASDRAAFLDDAKSALGEKAANKPTEPDINYWTYRYFNQGRDGAKKLLEKVKKAKIPRWTGDPEGAGKGYSKNARSNALVRASTTEYLKCTGVFDVPEEEPAPTPTPTPA